MFSTLNESVINWYHLKTIAHSGFSFILSPNCDSLNFDVTWRQWIPALFSYLFSISVKHFFQFTNHYKFQLMLNDVLVSFSLISHIITIRNVYKDQTSTCLAVSFFFNERKVTNLPWDWKSIWRGSHFTQETVNLFTYKCPLRFFPSSSKDSVYIKKENDM